MQVQSKRNVLTVAAVTWLAASCFAGAWLAPQARSGHDQTPPQTYITAGPPVRTTDRTPSFSFAASEQAARFVCKLDARPFKPCASPKTLRRLPRGRDRLLGGRGRDSCKPADVDVARSCEVR